ncbi:MAG: hypothetical protein J0M08_05360 [Bacteroidetes bacterium]|nr:hypothetical protein [Bacteroidota bacterium]
MKLKRNLSFYFFCSVFMFFQKGFTQIIDRAYLDHINSSYGEVALINFIDSCAKRKNIECMFNKYVMYYDSRKIDSAVVLLLEIACQNIGSMDDPYNRVLEVRNSLGIMYLDGFVLKQDFYLSYVWFLVYNEHKNSCAQDVQQNNIKRIKYVQKKLSKSEILSAQKDATFINKGPLKNTSKLFVME